MRILAAVLLAVLVPRVARAQSEPGLSILPAPVDSISDPRAPMPASHRSAVAEPDQPVRVKFCPPPPYPSTPSIYGYPVRVGFVFVVDTLGRPEMDDIVIKEVTDRAFVGPARRAISKCRYEPGHPVRALVQQAVNYRGAPEWPFDSGKPYPPR
jgi:hypothetical protein